MNHHHAFKVIQLLAPQLDGLLDARLSGFVLAGSKKMSEDYFRYQSLDG